MGLPLKKSKLDETPCVQHAESCDWIGKVMNLEGSNEEGWKITVKLCQCKDGLLKREEEILLSYYHEIDAPWELLRQEITFEAVLKEAATRQNPKCFDYALYLKSQDIQKIAKIGNFTIKQTQLNPIDNLTRFLIKLRYQFSDTLSPEAKGLVNGVLFGDTSALSEEVYDAFRNNGTAHILAVSGLHVGILYGIYKKIMGKRRSKLAMLSLAFCMFSYGTISLWAPSVFRASIMIGLRILADVLDLRYDPLTSLSTVALLLIVRNPYIIFSTGFQMSFLAILSICFLVPIMPKYIPDFIVASIAVNIGLALFQMYQFNYISLVSLVVNLPVIYLTGVLVPLALLSFLWFALTSMEAPWAVLLDSLSWLIIKINQFSTLNGKGSVDVTSPPLWLATLLLFLLFFLSSETFYILKYRKDYRRLAKYFLSAIIGISVISLLSYCPVSCCQLVFVDVGQGDCIHLKSGSKNVLIDGGGSANYNVGKELLKPYLLKNGVSSVDLALATHEHMDHYQGLVDLEGVYPVKQLKSGMILGNSIKLSKNIWIETLWPIKIDPEVGQEENHDCSVFMIHYGKWKILITGDLDEKGELELLDYYKKIGQEKRLKADILKAGHHGSHTSTSDAFLDAVNPKVVVIQVGEGNLYGHPHDIVIEKCLKKGIIVLRNDYHGAIGFRFKEDRYQIHTVIS